MSFAAFPTAKSVWSGFFGGATVGAGVKVQWLWALMRLVLLIKACDKMRGQHAFTRNAI